MRNFGPRPDSYIVCSPHDNPARHWTEPAACGPVLSQPISMGGNVAIDHRSSTALAPATLPLFHPSVFESRTFVSGLMTIRHPTSTYELCGSNCGGTINLPNLHPGSPRPLPPSRAPCGSKWTQGTSLRKPPEPPATLRQNDRAVPSGSILRL